MTKSNDRNITSRVAPDNEAPCRVVTRRHRKGAASAPFEGNGPAFFTVPQLAIRWGLSQRQIFRFIASGELADTKFGRSVRVSIDEVAQFEAARKGVK